MARIVIVGGGMAGLSAAYRLSKEPRHQVTLIEASERLGGKVASVRQDGFLIEQGPDSVFSFKPWAVDLMVELGLEDQLIGPKGSEFSILVGGKLHAVPRALASLMPSAAGVLEKVGFLSAAAKRRALSEKDAPKGDGSDESIASFFRRRFGKRFSMLIAEPLLAGIHAGDPEKLSMKALYPSYLGLEQKHGSLSGATPQTGTGTQPRRPAFVALRDGMGSFVGRLAERLDGVDVRLSSPVEAIERTDGLTVVAGDQFEADHLVLAIPAYAASGLLRRLAPQTAAALDRIRTVSTAVVSLGYPAAAFPKGLYGNGFLVPSGEKSPITGCTWSSQKWEGRAPDGSILIRVFMGLDGGLNIDEHDDGALVEMAEKAIGEIAQPTLPPQLRRLDRWPRSMPQYEVGHLDLLAEAETGLAGLPISLVGSSYRGNGMPDCVRQGRDVAVALLERTSA